MGLGVASYFSDGADMNGAPMLIEVFANGVGVNLKKLTASSTPEALGEAGALVVQTTD